MGAQAILTVSVTRPPLLGPRESPHAKVLKANLAGLRGMSRVPPTAHVRKAGVPVSASEPEVAVSCACHGAAGEPHQQGRRREAKVMGELDTPHTGTPSRGGLGRTGAPPLKGRPNLHVFVLFFLPKMLSALSISPILLDPA